MKLSLDKTISVTINRTQSSINFFDGSLVVRKKQAVYLLASSTDSVDNHKEVLRRMAWAKPAQLPKNSAVSGQKQVQPSDGSYKL